MFGTEFVLWYVWFAENRREMNAVSQDSSKGGRAVWYLHESLLKRPIPMPVRSARSDQ